MSVIVFVDRYSNMQHTALHNLHTLTPDLYSAAEPVGEPAYDELAALGIKTVISVDGIAPNKELADQYGIRVVHIPTTYDGITDEQSKQLAHAIATMPRPIFVNCQHGKHRGPAALCVGAIGAGEITIPMGPWSGTAARRRAVASALNNDLSTAKAAALAGVHERTAWRVKARQKSAPGELPLFSDS